MVDNLTPVPKCSRLEDQTLISARVMVILAYFLYEPENSWKEVFKSDFMLLLTVSQHITGVLLYNWIQGVCVCACISAYACVGE